MVGPKSMCSAKTTDSLYNLGPSLRKNKRYMIGLPISGVFVVACLPRIGLTLDTFMESSSLGDGRSL